jgi:hypothetical protein
MLPLIVQLGDSASAAEAADSKISRALVGTVKSLQATLLSAMPGEVTNLQREDCRRLAHLMTLAERARYRMLEGRRTDSERWLRTENLNRSGGRGPSQTTARRHLPSRSDGDFGHVSSPRGPSQRHEAA